MHSSPSLFARMIGARNSENIEGKRGNRDRHAAPQESRWPTPHRTPPENPQTRTDEEPMQLGRARLSQEERQKRRQEGRCFYCGETGHLVSSCPAKRTPVVSSNQVAKTAVRVLTQVKLNSQFDMDVLIDSGADESLMDWNLAKKLHIDCEPLARPIRARSLNGADIIVIFHISSPLKLSWKSP